LTVRSIIRFVSLGAAAALVIYGLSQPIEQDSRWIASLWIALPLLYIAARLWLQPMPPGIARNIQHLALAITIGFCGSGAPVAPAAVRPCRRDRQRSVHRSTDRSTDQ
jgi:hypothetical protein